MEMRRPKFSLFYKILMLTALIVLLVVPSLTYINIRTGLSVLRSELAEKEKIMRADLAEKGTILSKSLTQNITEAVSGYNFNFLNEVIPAVLKLDRQVLYAILMNRERVAFVHSDKSKSQRLLEEEIDKKSSEAVSLTNFEYQKGNQKILEVVSPVFIGKDKWGVLRIGFSLELVEAEILRSKKNMEANVVEHIKKALIFAFLFIILAVILSVFFSRRLSNPIKKVTDLTQLIANGDLSNRIEIPSGDELGLLAASVNSMSEKLKISFEKIANQNRKLLEMDKLKTEFLANTSHELRTPLNGIIGITETILENPAFNISEAVKEKLRLIIGSGRRLSGLISNLLDLSALHSNKTQLRLQSFSLRELIESVLELSQGLIGKREIRLFASYRTENYIIKSDKEKLRQILINLIGNALKFTEKGSVEINLKGDENFYEIRIKDTGIGIAGENFDIIFDEFRQLDGASTRNYGGTGLGLSITKKFVGLLKGEISLESELGIGTEFFLKFPQALSVTDLVQSEKGQENFFEAVSVEKENRVNYSNPSNDFNELAEEEEPYNELKSANQEKILIVDDDPTNVEVLKGRLSLVNFIPVAATDPFIGLELAAREKPEVILLDLMMPKMSGNEFCLKIKEDPLLKNIPIIIVSAKNKLYDRIRSLYEGADDYLVKPFDKNELIAKLNVALRLKKLRDELEKEKELLDTTLSNIGDGVITIDDKGTIILINEMVEKMTGWTSVEAVGSNISKILTLMDSKTRTVLDNLDEKILKLESFTKTNRENILVSRDKKEYFIDLICAKIESEGRIQTGNVIAFSDITEQRKAEETIKFQATHDALTQLPNRRLLKQFLTDELESIMITRQKLALLFIDLDRFKLINDSLGHSFGDILLKEVAKLLQKSIRHGDMVARLGGDEFTVLLTELYKESHAELIAQKIIDSFKAPFLIDGQEFYTSCSIGISIYPADGDNEVVLMKKADTAMYYAKKQGRNNYQLYRPEIEASSVSKLSLHNNIRKALERNEFFLVFQPIIDISRNRLMGAETLLRWNSAELGFIPPNEFIPVAEEIGLISELDEWVLRRACLQAKEWQNEGYNDFIITVNISPIHFNQGTVPQLVRDTLFSTSLNPKFLEIEITESSIMKNFDFANRELKKLYQLGVSIALDDFGTGYSSLSYLKNLYVNILKIDKSFIDEINTDKNTEAIIKSIIYIADCLNMDVIAEGIEQKEQLEKLKEHGCRLIQGYYFSRPEKGGDFREKILLDETFISKKILL